MNEQQPGAPAPMHGGFAQASSPQARASPWAIWALVCGLLGLCCFPVGLAGAALGVVALVKMEKDKALSGKGMAIAGLAIGASSVFINGILAALAIPAFVGYTRRAKTTEVTANIDSIYAAVERRYQENGAIEPVPLTPSEIPCGDAHVWSAEELARFAGLGFAPSGHTYFSYEVVADSSDVPSLVARIRARGDLDCDGTASLFELAVGKDGSGALTRASGFYIVNEVE